MEIITHFRSACYENSYQLQNILKNYEFFVLSVHHKQQQNGEWKSPISLEFAFFTTVTRSSKC
jgi:hypothetical protein